MTTTNRTSRLMPVLGALLGLLLPAAAAAQEGTAPAERAAIEAALDGSLAAGYREKSVEKYLSAYVPEARIVNYIWGQIDRETLGKKTLGDFAAITVRDARVDVLEARVEGAEALVTISFGVTGALEGGGRANRHDRYYLRMRKDDAGWRIVEQSYRADFGSTAAPHGAPR